jgi:hypothetical protein
MSFSATCQAEEVKLRFTHRADKDYAALPPPVRRLSRNHWTFFSTTLPIPPFMPRSTTKPRRSGKRESIAVGDSIS